ncbi:MAG: cyclic nucleotide-binding domain-containing protein [Cyclobacteriaceae bacterium]|jgi:CRP/FNR family transcriptional regulator, cyclic AMP receptor protein|nr:cyclic nucleotide-binding domain-containing protein [Cyclobacteriaceae bacterium]
MINPFKKSYSIKELNLFRMLSKVKPFERLNYEEMSLFVPHLYLREYKLDEAVFFRNDPSNAFYIVKSGKVSLNIDINKTFEVLQVLKSGGYFGHNAFLENSIRVYSAIIISEISELYVLPQVNIMEIFDTRAKIKAKMMTSLAELYNDFNHKIFNTYRSSLGFFNLSDAYQK